MEEPQGGRGAEHRDRRTPVREAVREHRHVRPGPAAAGAEHVAHREPLRRAAERSGKPGHRGSLPLIRAATARRSPPSRTRTASPNTTATQAQASTATPALPRKPETGSAADTAAPAAPPATAPVSPATAARPVPRRAAPPRARPPPPRRAPPRPPPRPPAPPTPATAARPVPRRAARPRARPTAPSRATPDTVRPTVLPRPRTGTTQRADTSATAATSAAKEFRRVLRPVLTGPGNAEDVFSRRAGAVRFAFAGRPLSLHAGRARRGHIRCQYVEPSSHHESARRLQPATFARWAVVARRHEFAQAIFGHLRFEVQSVGAPPSDSGRTGHRRLGRRPLLRIQLWRSWNGPTVERKAGEQRVTAGQIDHPAGSPWCLQRTSLAHAGGRAGPALSCGSVRVQSGSPPRPSRYGARRRVCDPAIHGPRGPYRPIGACQSHGGQSRWPRFVRNPLQWSESAE